MKQNFFRLASFASFLLLSASLMSSCSMEELAQWEQDVEAAQQAQEQRRSTYRNILVRASDYRLDNHATSVLFSKGFHAVRGDDFGAVLSVELLQVSESSGSGSTATIAGFTAGTPTSRHPGYKAQVRATITDANTGKTLWKNTGTTDSQSSSNREDAINSACTNALKTLPERRHINW